MPRGQLKGYNYGRQEEDKKTTTPGVNSCPKVAIIIEMVMNSHSDSLVQGVASFLQLKFLCIFLNL